jgi:hypothetical protein
MQSRPGAETKPTDHGQPNVNRDWQVTPQSRVTPTAGGGYENVNGNSEEQ